MIALKITQTEDFCKVMQEVITKLIRSRPPVRYWGRKPIDLCLKLIEKYSKQMDIVLDPFGGAGSITLAALVSRRRCVYLDINPYAWLVACVLINSVEDVDAYLAAVSEVLQRSRIYFVDKLGRKRWINRNKLWSTLCPNCNEVKQILYFEWIDSECYAILECGHKIEYGDVEAIPLYPHPDRDKLYYDDRIPFLKRRKVDYIRDLYTERALIQLSAMLHDIDKVARRYSTDIVLALYLTFASILYDASKMTREGAGSWGVPCYWIPPRHLEKNPYTLFEKRAKTLARWFRLINEIKRKFDIRVTTDVNRVLNGEASVCIQVCSALKITDILPADSVDLVVTDPPHMDEIQYLELSYMYYSWLRVSKLFRSIFRNLTKRELLMDFKEELTVNSSQGKSLSYYLEKFRIFVERMYSVLKANHYAVLILHEEDKVILSTIVNIICKKLELISKEPIMLSQRNIGDRDTVHGREFFILTMFKRSLSVPPRFYMHP